MAQTTTKTFNMIAMILALLLVVASGVVWLQSGSSGGGNNATFAALSQAVARHANAAAAGDTAALRSARA